MISALFSLTVKYKAHINCQGLKNYTITRFCPWCCRQPDLRTPQL